MTDGDYNKAHACFSTALKHTESFLAGVGLVYLNSALIAPSKRLNSALIAFNGALIAPE